MEQRFVEKKDIALKCLKSWKIILLCAILGAVAGGYLGYVFASHYDYTVSYMRKFALNYEKKMTDEEIETVTDMLDDKKENTVKKLQDEESELNKQLEEVNDNQRGYFYAKLARYTKDVSIFTDNIDTGGLYKVRYSVTGAVLFALIGMFCVAVVFIFRDNGKE